jgi:hypothetical protein
MKAQCIAASLVAVGSCFGFLAVALAQKDVVRPVSKPLVVISGIDSHVKQPSYTCITTAEDWRRTWARHINLPTVRGRSVDDLLAITEKMIMQVDFDRCLAVVIFRGEQIQVRQITVDSVLESVGSITIRFKELHYGIDLGPNESPRPLERPYAFIVLPKTNKEIVLQEKIWSKEDERFGRPPKWEEWARLSPERDSRKS